MRRNDGEAICDFCFAKWLHYVRNDSEELSTLHFPRIIMETLVQSLISEGYKVTAKRMQIIDHLRDKAEICDIEELWLEIRSTECISWATVYTTVKMLHKLGWLELQKENAKKNVYRWREI